jgi:hypothetical protein
MSKPTKNDRLGVASTVKTPQASLSVTKDPSGPDASAQKALDGDFTNEGRLLMLQNLKDADSDTLHDKSKGRLASIRSAS